jgi:hypothetical protein
MIRQRLYRGAHELRKSNTLRCLLWSPLEVLSAPFGLLKLFSVSFCCRLGIEFIDHGIPVFRKRIKLFSP